jgi:hypothetical protein
MISHGLSFVISNYRQVKTMDIASCHYLDYRQCQCYLKKNILNTADHCVLVV